jgi:hypothetical protein
MDPRDFLDLARKLSSGHTVAERRTAISRAYYATHHVGAQFLAGVGCAINQNPSGHEEVIRNLSQCGDLELAGVGSKLSDLRSKRIIADYRLSNIKDENQKTTQAVVVQSERMILALDQCKSIERRDGIAKAVKEYLKKVNS